MSKPFTDAVVRLDFYLSHTLGLSRKEAKILIGKGHVNVNEQLVKKANHSVTRDDTIVCQDQVLSWPREKYFVLNKPAGFVCATDDDVHPVVLELIELHEQKDLRVVGRLDLDTTGLLLLTTDGQWLHRITSPKSQCPKQYRVWTAEDVSDEALQALTDGVLLHGEHAVTKAVSATRVECDEIVLTIAEGKYHQVKRMLAATGNRVERLHREKIASLSIEDLPEGEYRALTDEEIALF